MAEMNVSMLLTLVDRASPGVRTFMSLLEGVNTVVTSLNERIIGLQAGIRSVGTAASSSATGVSRLAAATESARAGTAALSAATPTAANHIQQLGAVVGATTAQIQAMVAQLGGVVAAATALQAQGHQNPMPGINQAHAGAQGLRQTLHAVAGIWAAMKVEKGFAASVAEAANLQAAEAQIKGLNLGAERTAQIMNKAFDDSKALKFVSTLDAVHNRLAAMGGLAQTMDDRTVDATLHQATKLANNLRVAGDKTKLQDLVRNAYGFVEARGQTHDPDAMNRSFDLLQRASTVTGGKVTLRDMEMMIRQLGQGATQISDEGLYKLIAVIDQMKVSGGEGGSGGGSSRVGTIVKMLEAYGMGKTMSKQGQAMFKDAGIIGADGNMMNSELIGKDPIGWVESLLPKIMDMTAKYSKTFYPKGNVNDPEATALAIQKFLTMTGVSVTTAQAEGLALQTDTRERINRQAEQGKNSLGVVEQAKVNAGLFNQAMENFHASLDRFAAMVGERVMPVVTLLVTGFTQLLDWMTQLGNDNKLLAWVNIAGVAFGSLSVFLISAARLFMHVLPEAVAAGVGALASGLSRMVGIAGALLLAWDIGTIIGGYVSGWLDNIKIGGVAISVWIGAWMDGVVTTVANAWIRIQQFFGFISKAAADSQVAANNAEMNAAYRANTQVAPSKGDTDRRKSGVVTDILEDGVRKPYSDVRSGTWGNAAVTSHGSADHRDAGGKTFTGGKKPKSGGYNEAADILGQEYKQENDELRTNLKIADALYKEGLSSVEEYYQNRQAALEIAVERERMLLVEQYSAFARKNDRAGMHGVETKLERVDNMLDSGTAENSANRKQDLLKLDKEAADLQRNLLQTSGQRRAAELLHIQQEMEQKIQLLLLNGRITQDEANGMRVSARAAQEYHEQYVGIAKIHNEYADKIALIDDLERNGAIGQTEAENRKLELRKEEARQLDELIAKLRELAVISNNDKAISDLDKMSIKNRSVEGQRSPEQVQVFSSIRGGFQNVFRDVISGAESGGAALDKFMRNLKNTFTDIISKRLGDALFDSLFGNLLTGGKGSGGGGGGLFGLIGGLFKGWGSGSSSSSGGSGFGDSGSASTVGMSFATGADYIPYDMVAEIHRGERIMTATDNIQYTSFMKNAARPTGLNNPPSSMQVSFDQSMRNTRVVDLLDSQIQHEMYDR